MNKDVLLHKIITILAQDLEVLTGAAKAAHAAATHAECIADNKYDTTGLEASYLAQGQANRAADIRLALERYRSLALRSFDEQAGIRLTACVTLEAEDGALRRVFLGPEAGGLKVTAGAEEYIVITPESPLGRALIGKVCGEEVHVGHGESRKAFTVVDVA